MLNTTKETEQTSGDLLQWLKAGFSSTLMVLSLLLAICEQTDAQSWKWVKGVGGTSTVYSAQMAVDPGNGDVYTTGTFNGTVDFDPGLDSFNITGYGMFISKLDSAGNFIWAKAINGFELNSQSIAFDPSGNGSVYTTGSFKGTADFDPGPGVFYITAPVIITDFCGYCMTIGMYISKLDTAGNFVWAKAMLGSTDISVGIGNAIAVETGGGAIYTTGTYSGTIDFDPGPGISSFSGFWDIFISKLDGSGNLVWTKVMNGGGYDHGQSIALDPIGDGAVYTTGRYEGTVDFDPGAEVFNLTSAGGTDGYISKLDGSGNLVWTKVFGGTGYDGSRSIAFVSADGEAVYTTGFFTGTVDFDPAGGIFNLSSAGGTDVCISKLDASGNFIWAKAMGGAGFDIGLSIAIDAVGKVYTTGSFEETGDFDPGGGMLDLTSEGGSDVFVSKLDISGNFEWAIGVGGTGSEYVYYENGSSLTLDAFGNVFLTGSFESPSISIGSTILVNPETCDYYYDEEGNEFYYCDYYSDIFITKLAGATLQCTAIVTSSGDSGIGSLRDIISCTSPGTTITFSLAPMSQIILTTGEIVINKDLTLSGPGILDLIISGNNDSRIFNLLSGKNLIIEDLSLKNAGADTNGGAVFVKGNLTLNNVLLENNFENTIPKGLTLISPGSLDILANVVIKN